MNVHLAVYDILFNEELPELHKYFKSLELQSDMYIIDWLLTLFSRSLPLDVASRVWDYYFYEGELAVFRVCLGKELLLNISLNTVWLASTKRC